MDARHEHARAERFAHVVGGAHLQAGDDVGFAVFGREHDDGNVARFRLGLEAAADFEAVDARQHQIEQDHGGGPGFERKQRVFAVFDGLDQ